jgi:hypothetical protein
MSEESEYVTLISSDGYSFIIQRSSACISGAIKRMLDPPCIQLTRVFRWFRRIKKQHVPL